MKEEKSWYSNWFDSAYYHLLYQHRDHKEAERFIRNLTRFLAPDKDDHIMDLACGKGRHSAYLNSLGHKVTGLDLSSNNIQHAKQLENDRLHFDVHDMRDIYQANQFDFIFNLFTSFGYFESSSEDEKVLRAIQQQLKPGGVLVLDYLNAVHVRNTLVKKEIKKLSGIDFKIERFIHDDVVIKQISFSDRKESYQFQERVELIHLEQFKQHLDVTGLQLLHTFGSYDLEPFDVNTSNRLILIAKKEG